MEIGPLRLTLPRFYPILDTGRPLALPLQIQAAVAAGVRILQIRHKGFWSRELVDQTRELAQGSVTVIVNDRADVAALAECGVHVGQTDLHPKQIAPLMRGRPIGFSTHNEAQLRAALDQPAAYLALGPIFATTSKNDPDPTVGLAELGRLRPLCDRPLVAIGGITRATAQAVVDAGADSIAVIGDLYPDPLTPETMRRRMEAWNRLLH